MAAATSPTSTGRPARSGHGDRRTVGSRGPHRSGFARPEPQRRLSGRATRRHAARALQDDRRHAGGTGHRRGRPLGNGGVTFGPAELVAERFEEQIIGVRAPVLVTADVDAAGTVYVAWGDCRFSPTATQRHRLRDVRRRHPLDGAATRAIPEQPGARLVRAGARGRAGHFRRRAQLAVAALRGDAGVRVPRLRHRQRFAITSPDGGRTWGPARRLNAEPMRRPLDGGHRRGQDARRLRLDVVRRRTARRRGLARDETPARRVPAGGLRKHSRIPAICRGRLA